MRRELLEAKRLKLYTLLDQGEDLNVLPMAERLGVSRNAILTWRKMWAADRASAAQPAAQ